MFVTPKVIAIFYPNLKLTVLTVHFITISYYLIYILLCTAPLSADGGAIANAGDMI